MHRLRECNAHLRLRLFPQAVTGQQVLPVMVGLRTAETRL